MKPFPLLLALVVAVSRLAFAEETKLPNQASLEKMTARFAPTEIKADLSKLSPGDRKVLAKLVEAAQVIDGIFLRQAWAGNAAMLLDLAHDKSPEGWARLHYFLINKGPWSSVDHDAPFVLAAPPKPKGANFYPADASKEEIESWIKSLPADEQERAKGFFTVVRRTADKKLTLVPYNVEYQNELMKLAELLRAAAADASEPTLKRFLITRADAFLSNDYYQSDVAWMELASAIEPTIGPYEVYQDGWFNYKAAFEAFITVQDETESAKLKKFSGHLQEIEDHLPIDPKYRNPKIGALSPMVVVNVVYTSGDGNHGVQTAAYNLPNDERITREKGSKRIMLRNVQDAKFTKTLVPISHLVLSPNDQKNVSFDAFFTHTVMHEMMHGLGPHDVTIDGRHSTVRAELKETYSALEEAKADISGLSALQFLIDQGVIDKSLEKSLYVTYLASCFRSLRFGTNEAHGLGTAVQLNYLLGHGAFVANRNATFSVDPNKIKPGIEGLTHEIMTLQAEGDYARAKKMDEELGVIRPEVQKAIDKMNNIPIDIEPQFVTAQQLVRENP